MTDSLVKASVAVEDASTLQRDAQQATPSGTKSESALRCQATLRGPRTPDGKGWQKGPLCGARPHPTRPGICENGHPLPGNQLSRTTEEPTRETPADLAEFNELEMLKIDAIGLKRQVGDLDTQLASKLTRAQRKRLRRERRESSAELREVLREIARVPPPTAPDEGPQLTLQKVAVLKLLPDGVLRVLQTHLAQPDPQPMTDDDFLAAWSEAGGPAPLHIELTTVGTTPGAKDLFQVTGPLRPPAPDQARPTVADVDGGIASPLLVKGNRPPLPFAQPRPPAIPEGPYQVVGGNPVAVKSGALLPDPDGPVFNLPLDGSFVCVRRRDEPALLTHASELV